MTSEARKRGPWRGAGLGLALAALAGAGCGPGKGDVSGKVTYKGKPLVYGSVQFVGRDGQPKLAEIAKDGTYRAPGVTAGENQIAVNSGNPAQSVMLDKSGRPKEPPPVDPKLWFPIPDKYGDTRKSGLTFTVEKNVANTHDIDLQ